MVKTVVALYDNYADAQDAVRELLENGFNRRNISIAANDVVRHPSAVLTEASVEEKDAEDRNISQGAGTGAVVGGIAGLIVGLAALTVPGIGPLLVAGPLAGVIAGAGLGLVVGGLLGALIKAGIPQSQAEYYAEGVRRGGTLVTIQADDPYIEHALHILDRHNAVNIEERSTEWRQTGWTAYDPKAAAYTAEEIAKERERLSAARPEPYLPPAAALSSTTPAYQAGVPVPPIAIAPVNEVEEGSVDEADIERTSIADVPPPNTPNPHAQISRRPVGVYPYPEAISEQGEMDEPPMPMDILPQSERELAGAKGGAADTRAGERPGDYQNSELGGDVSVFDSLSENP